MIERRKEVRSSVKTISLNKNKISKIMFIKSIFIALFVVVVGISYIVYLSISGYLDISELKQETDNILQKTEVVKQKIRVLEQENIKLDYGLQQVDPSKNIDLKEVEVLAERAVSLLKLKNLISDYSINVEKLYEYKNVAKINIRTSTKSIYINERILKSIFMLVFDQIFYIKNITTSKNMIEVEVYKKVDT